MEIAHADRSDKGWYFGPWNSVLPIAVGYANRGIDEPHVHSQIMEIYLVARGTAEIRVERQTIRLSPGDVILVEPGEAHTFLSSSQDYFHFVLHSSDPYSESARTEKTSVTRERLGL